jgi:regulatory protein
VEVARQIVLRQLTQGPRTRTQLAEALAKRHVPDEAARAVLDRFAELGLVDDHAYAEAYLRSARSDGRLSRRRVAERLRERGVEAQIVADTVAAIDPDEEFEAASRLARKRAPRLAGLERTVQQRRLAGVLARYGFPSSVVHRAVDQVLAELAVDGVLPDGAAVSGAGNGTAWR